MTIWLMVDHHRVHGGGVVVVRGDHGDPRHLVVARSTARGAGGAGVPIVWGCTRIVVSVRLVTFRQRFVVRRQAGYHLSGKYQSLHIFIFYSNCMFLQNLFILFPNEECYNLTKLCMNYKEYLNIPKAKFFFTSFSPSTLSIWSEKFHGFLSQPISTN